MKYCIIIGSSRGLGAAMVEEFLKDESCFIIGVARTSLEKIHDHEKWIASERYRHVELDITAPNCIESLKLICSEIPREPICIIFNAAIVKADFEEDSSINFGTFDEINRVGIDGLGNVLNAFEEQLLDYGGILVGISSFSALAPPVFEPRVAYPASKAYLDMTLRSLRPAWKKKVKIVTVHLGHIGGSGSTFFSSLMVPPTYSRAARKIVRKVMSRRTPTEINYPLLYCIVYRYLFKFIPDVIYLLLFRLLLNLSNLVKTSKT